MPVPKQVRDRAAEGERIASELKLKGAPVLDPVVDPEKDNHKPDDKPEKIDPNDWKARFDGLTKAQGKLKQQHATEIAERDSTISRLTGQLEVLQTQNADLLQQSKSAPEVAAPAPAVNTNASMQERILSVLNDEEKESYSQEFLDMLARVIQTAVVPSSAPAVDDDIKTRLETVEKNQSLTAEETFWKKINESVPNWRDIQADDAFQSYLAEHDPLLEDTRLNVLVKSQKSLNASRAIAVFMNFINRAHDHAPDDEDEADPLLKHLVPDDTGAGDGGDVDAVLELTPEQIGQFYQDVALGRYKNQPDKYRAMEVAINKILKQQNVTA